MGFQANTVPTLEYGFRVQGLRPRVWGPLGTEDGTVALTLPIVPKFQEGLPLQTVDLRIFVIGGNPMD